MLIKISRFHPKGECIVLRRANHGAAHEPGSSRGCPAYENGRLFQLYFSVTMAGCWEIYEFTTDPLFRLQSRWGSLADTMSDIICGIAGGLATAVFYSVILIRGRQKTAAHSERASRWN
ncbi:hypothetical protein O9H85_01075 [Paenibacillus filicis]|uniref:VanZ-like domain-containing protein n=1 Tax=Paenibacillus gyeongsangnamensis TaxID=3388067 RepID=A0ABT4Q2I4_9BACL|nr:hypothetical protein [Paenibacillus filicis]MCZ8511049.1 hypothetical protein [Paenibacillus filicis]